mgnify:CR=1 FL=1
MWHNAGNERTLQNPWKTREGAPSAAVGLRLWYAVPCAVATAVTLCLHRWKPLKTREGTPSAAVGLLLWYAVPCAVATAARIARTGHPLRPASVGASEPPRKLPTDTAPAGGPFVYMMLGVG